MKALLVPVLLALLATGVMAQTRAEDKYVYRQGTASVTDAAKTADVLAAVSGFFHHVERVVISCHVAAEGGAGVVNLNHGATTIFTADADAVGVFVLDFGPRGNRSPAANNALELEVADAVTTDASCIATAISHLVR